MSPLSLKDLLKRSGSHRLSAIIGSERLESIHEILGTGLTESRMVDVLYRRYGTQILGNPAIRTLVLARLPDAQAGYVLDGKTEEGRKLTPKEKDRLTRLRWGRTLATSARLIEVLGLSEDYLPEKVDPPPAETLIEPTFTLFPHQRRLKDQIVRRLAGGESRILVHMPTGAGKTRTCTEALADFWRAYAERDGFFVWLAHSEELCEQAVETLSLIWKARGDTAIPVFRLWGTYPAPEFSRDQAFVVASLQKLHSLRTSSSNEAFSSVMALQSRCQLIVVDEAHKAIAETYRDSIEFLFNTEKTKLIGLTATPGRGIDSPENASLVRFFDGNKVGLVNASGQDVPDPIGYLQGNGFLAKVIRRKVSSDLTLDLTQQELRFVETFLEVPSSVLKRIGESHQRNACIIGEIAALVKDGRNIIVFACSVEHGHLLSELLNLRKIPARSIDGRTAREDRQQWIRDFKDGTIRVLVNFGVLTTGFDAPNTNAVVITRPTGSIVLYSQMLGRGIRGPKVGGNPDCVLVDIEDNLIGFPDERKAFTFFDEAWSHRAAS